MKVSDVITMLERDESLELENVEHTYGEEQQPVTVNYDQLFPAKLYKDGREGEDWDLYGDEWNFEDEQVVEDIRRAALDGETASSGTPTDWPEDITKDVKSVWDSCAWYQPIHFFGYDWGIYIREDCLLSNALGIASQLNLAHSPKNPHLLAKAVLRASFATFFLHEHYHHKVESFGLRLHVVKGKSCYLPYKKNVYRPNLMTDQCLEEGLANASAYNRISSSPYKKAMGDTVLHATREYLKGSFPKDPPGYRLASGLLGSAFTRTENEFKGQVKEASLHPTQSPEDWKNAPDIMRPFFRVDQNIYTVVKRGRQSILPTTVFLKSCSTQDMIKICESKGYFVVSGGKGSHVKLKKPGNKPVILRGNRKDLSSGLIQSVLKVIGYKAYDLPQLLDEI